MTNNHHSQYYIDLVKQYGTNTYNSIEVVVKEGSGIWVTDVDGNRYIDCLSAYSAVNQGHRHPKIQQALLEQAGRVTLTSRVFFNDQIGPYMKELCELMGYEMILPMNTGAEAVESAIKSARKWGYKVKGVAENQAEIIVCANNFAGRTTTIISFSSTEQYREDFGPFTPGFVIVPFGDADALEAAITPNTVAFLFEPIQGEGGIVVPPEGYIKRVREICDRHNILMIADEIQTGLGRTGYLLACQHEGVRPDMITLGKALSGGMYPVSAVLADREVLGLYRPGDHGSTFGGNPLGCAVARVAIKVIVEENLIDNSREMGIYFMDRLQEINSPHIKEVRGRGLLIGVELHPEAGGARKYCNAMKDHGVLCADTHEHIIRFAPPLIIQKPEIDLIVDRFAEVMMAN